MMGRPLPSSRDDIVAGTEAELPPVLLELPANLRHVSTVALQGATAMAYFAACGQPVTAARGCAAVHCLDTDSNRRLVSSVVQLLLDRAPPASSAEQNGIAAAPQPASGIHDVTREQTAAQTMPPGQAAAHGATPAVAKAAGPGSPAKHEPGRWRPPPEPANAAPQPAARARCHAWWQPLQLAHALQAAHASPAALGPDDPTHLAALLLPRKAGPPRLLRRKPRKRSSDQLLEAADELGGSSPVLAGSRTQPGRLNALRLRAQAAKRPAWAQPTVAEHDEQEQDLLKFVNEL